MSIFIDVLRIEYAHNIFIINYRKKWSWKRNMTNNKMTDFFPMKTSLFIFEVSYPFYYIILTPANFWTFTYFSNILLWMTDIVVLARF